VVGAKVREKGGGGINKREVGGGREVRDEWGLMEKRGGVSTEELEREHSRGGGETKKWAVGSGRGEDVPWRWGAEERGRKEAERKALERSSEPPLRGSARKHLKR